jgi:uncharacterized protein (DUF58 family)
MKRFLRKRFAAWIRRRQGPDVPPVQLVSRRVYILPTAPGVGYATMVLVMLIAGINYGNSIALFLTFLLAGFALVAMHQCHRNLVRTSLISAAAFPTFAKTRGTLRAVLQNDASFMRYGIEIEPRDQDASQGDIRPRAQVQIDAGIDAPVRGILRIDRLKISTTFPFGLFRAWGWMHMPIDMIVYPRAHGALPMPMDSGFKSGQRSQGLAGADEWLGLRPFREGDSPRQVAWKSYARGAPLLVKEYSAMGAELRMFNFSGLEKLTVEARLEQLARWVVDAETRGERYGLIIPLQRIEPDTGPQHRHRCLTALALHDRERASNDG